MTPYESNLWRRYHALREANETSQSIMLRNELVAMNIGLAWRVARRYCRHLPKFVRVEEIASSAHVGLIDAVEKFDPESGPWLGYASCRIWGAITDGLRECDQIPRLSRRRGDRRQITPMSQISRRELEQARQRSEAKAPDAKVYIVKPSAKLASDDAFSAMTEDLDREAKLMIRLYFGEELNMREIGQSIGLTESRISQLIRAALNEIKAKGKDRLMELAGMEVHP